jgi:hypothetical protein
MYYTRQMCTRGHEMRFPCGARPGPAAGLACCGGRGTLSDRHGLEAAVFTSLITDSTASSASVVHLRDGPLVARLR